MSCRGKLPRLEIRRRPDLDPTHGAVTQHDLEILLDGHEIRGLNLLDLTIRPGDANQATLRLTVETVEIDADVLAFLEAHVRNEAGS